ncbi:MAG: family 78 glycoside hydrolase catalytic domain [Anaerolineae bacterium]|nr:family 78 glycoside hydrolase catalytic domain [Anaerolineae bacterium]
MAQSKIVSDSSKSVVTISEIRIEHLRRALGIGTDRPRLSWMVETEIQGWRQAGYEIEAYDANGKTRSQTGRVESDQSVFVAWPFAPLTSRERLTLRVRVWGMDGQPSPWSEPVPVEAGLFHVQDWTARFITPDWEEDISQAQPAPLLRREFDVRAGVHLARLYITALGVYEPQLNDTILGDHVMSPGWTSYHHRLRYQTFDVTSLLHEGRNAIGVMLGDGWFRGRLGFGGGRRNIYGDHLALLAQLEITYADGTTERVITDEIWRAATGPIRSTDIYDGENYDARLERTGWSKAGYHDDDWTTVRPIEWDLTTLVAPLGPPVRRTEVIEPIAILTSPSGRALLDFGQNLVGRLRLAVQGPAGQTITLRHAEVLENGELCTRPLRSAKATDHYILRGEGVETWEPRFTFHGFRYAEIDNWPGELNIDDIRAVVCHSDMERAGWFDCSDPLINRLHDNVVWSMRGNFFDIPTDCPQRDERLGWTGDIQVFSPAASFLYDVSGFLASWLQDLAAEQKEAGDIVPAVVPNTISWPSLGAAAWGDAAVIVPWVLYQRFGDQAVLAAQFESVRAWVEWMASLAGESRLWDRGFQFGDWLDPAAPPDQPGEARTDRHLVATAYFARSAELVGRAADVLGLAKEEARYLSLSNEIRQAFAREYITPAGRLVSDTQTAYALAIEFGLLPDPEQRQHAAECLGVLVRANGYHIGTGFVGTPLICDALCSIGNYAAAYRLLLQRECPSWLYPVTMGATTIWERWDSLLPDGSVNPGEMTSFNHYALGAIADWLHRVVGGLTPAEPGYRRLAIQPIPGGGLSRASAKHLTPYGMAECTWAIREGSIEVKVVIPPNTTASVNLPGKNAEPIEVGSGEHRWSYSYQDPHARRPLSIDNTIGELNDDPRAWSAVVDTLARLIPAYAFAANVLRSQGKTTLRQGLAMLPNADEVLMAIADALEEIE